MNWTDPKPPTNNVSNYDHVISLTPLGICIIEWKSWKNDPDYDIMIEDKYITTEYSLDEAKETARKHLILVRDSLNMYLND